MKYNWQIYKSEQIMNNLNLKWIFKNYTSWRKSYDLFYIIITNNKYWITKYIYISRNNFCLFWFFFSAQSFQLFSFEWFSVLILTQYFQPLFQVNNNALWCGVPCCTCCIEHCVALLLFISIFHFYYYEFSIYYF